MTWSIVQSNDHENGASSLTTCAVTLASPVSSGSTVVVFVGLATSSNDLVSVKDDKNNTYTLQTFVEDLGSDYGWHSCFFINITNGPITITATTSAAHAFTTILAIEVAPPAATTVTLDKSATNTQTNPGAATDAVTTGSVTTTAADFIIAGGVDAGSTGIVSGTGFTVIQNNLGGSFTTEYFIQGSAGAKAATFTATNGSDEYSTALLAFTATAVATLPRKGNFNNQAVKRAAYW